MIHTSPFLRYLLLINIFTFIARGIDKYKAKTQKRRISEKNLLRYAALGGWIGAILGMEFFRHKTIKGKFLIKFWVIAIIWIVNIILFLLIL